MIEASGRMLKKPTVEVKHGERVLWVCVNDEENPEFWFRLEIPDDDLYILLAERQRDQRHTVPCVCDRSRNTSTNPPGGLVHELKRWENAAAYLTLPVLACLAGLVGGLVFAWVR